MYTVLAVLYIGGDESLYERNRQSSPIEGAQVKCVVQINTRPVENPKDLRNLRHGANSTPSCRSRPVPWQFCVFVVVFKLTSYSFCYMQKNITLIMLCHCLSKIILKINVVGRGGGFLNMSIFDD